jgi:RNA-dependent RNA polymerase
LNRQIITLLVALGVPDQVFEELQDAQLTRIGLMLTNPRAAVEVLEKSCSGDGHQALEMLRWAIMGVICAYGAKDCLS